MFLTLSIPFCSLVCVLCTSLKAALFSSLALVRSTSRFWATSFFSVSSFCKCRKTDCNCSTWSSVLRTWQSGKNELVKQKQLSLNKTMFWNLLDSERWSVFLPSPSGQTALWQWYHLSLSLLTCGWFLLGWPSDLVPGFESVVYHTEKGPTKNLAFERANSEQSNAARNQLRFPWIPTCLTMSWCFCSHLASSLLSAFVLSSDSVAWTTTKNCRFATFQGIN